MNTAPLPELKPATRPGGCCGCLFFPAALSLIGGSVFWLFGFTVGVVFHALASVVWATTYAIGHALFGWQLPDIRSRERPPRRLQD